MRAQHWTGPPSRNFRSCTLASCKLRTVDRNGAPGYGTRLIRYGIGGTSHHCGPGFRRVAGGYRCVRLALPRAVVWMGGRVLLHDDGSIGRASPAVISQRGRCPWALRATPSACAITRPHRTSLTCRLCRPGHHQYGSDIRDRAWHGWGTELMSGRYRCQSSQGSRRTNCPRRRYSWSDSLMTARIRARALSSVGDFS